jgi:hypothetical protein
MNRPTRTLMFLLLAGCSAAISGCTNQPAVDAANSRINPIATADVNVGPKPLLDQIKQAVSTAPLSLGVESQEKGVIVTGWKAYEGDFHIARHWQERTRFRIEVIPDWDEPTGKSRVNVIAETEQRAAEGQSWDAESRVPRPARAKEILDQILAQVHAKGGK